MVGRVRPGMLGISGWPIRSGASMMKVLLGLCVGALVASICSGYDPGTEYHYHVEGQILHELGKKVHQHAGFYGRSDLSVQVKENAILVKITKAEVAAVNERPEEDKEHHFVSVPAATEHITKPFIINYKNNVLHDIKVHKDDPYWSVNLKKAVASRFQLNFNHANVPHETHSHKNHSRHDNDNYYHVMEDGLIGECDVAYEVDDAHHNEIHVTKTKNFGHCRNLNYKLYENDNPVRCYDCGNEIHTPLQLSDITHYKLEGTRKHYVVEEMKMEERLAYMPYGRKAEYIKGDSKLKLVLTGTQKIEEEIHLPGDVVTHNDMHFEFGDHEEIKTAEDLKKAHNNFLNFYDKPPLPVVYKQYDAILEIDDGKPYTEAFKTNSAPFQLLKLVGFLTQFSYDEILHMYDDHVEKGITDEKERLKRRRVFGDALIQTGTGPAFMFIKHAMTELNMKPKVASHYLSQLPLNLQEFSPVLLEEFYTLCEHPKVHDVPGLRSVCYLAFSRFVFTQCVKKPHNLYIKYPPVHSSGCTPETAEKYFQKMVKSHAGHSKNSLERITCIKTAGNFATLGSLEYLREIIHDTHLHPYYRFSAIWALWQTSEIHHREVFELVTPIYYNTSEPTEIRNVALMVLLFSEPELHQLQTIAERVEHEEDDQVKHYTVSTIRQIAEGHHPCYLRVIGMCKRVLRFFDRIPEVVERHDLRHSFTKWTDGYDRKWKIGGGSYFSYFTSNNSYVPQHVDLFIEDYVGKSALIPVQIGYTGYGLDKLIDHFFPFAKRKGDDHVDEELQHINEKIHVQPREPEPMLGDFHISVFGGEHMFFHFSDEMFENTIAEGAQKLPDIMNELKDLGKYTVNLFNVGKIFKFIIPSAIGWPIYVNRHEIDFLHFRNNQLKIKVDPNFFHHQDGDAPPTISVKTDMHVVHEKLVPVSSGVVGAVMHTLTAAGVIDRQYDSIPLKLKIVVEPTTPKIVLKYTPIVPHTRIMRSFIPFTAKLNMSNYLGHALKDGTVLPYNHKPHEMIKVEKNFFHDYLGYGINFKGSFPHKRTFDSWGSFWKFMCETNTREKIYYLETNPMANQYSYEVALTPAKEDPTTEIDVVLNFDYYGFFTKNNRVYKPSFPTVQDGHENYINSRGDRKATTCVVKAEKVSKGSKERKLVAELAYTHTLDNLYHKLDFSYDRAPYHSSETDHFKICYSSSILFPHIDTKKVHQLDTVDMKPEIDVAADIHFGKNCENDKKITVRGELSRTEEHQHMQTEREHPDAQEDEIENYDAVLYKHCKEDNEKGIHYSLNCRKYYYRALKLRHYSFDIHHENIDEKGKHHASKLEKALQLGMIYYLNIHPNEVANDSSKIHVEADFSAKTDHVDIKIRLPKETLEFDDVPHPDWIQARSATPFFDFTNKMVKSSYYRYPFCSIEGHQVKTFDNVHFDIPHAGIDCYTVLAKDCSEKNIFAVLGKKVSEGDHSKAVKVILPNMKIEAQPNGDHIAITLNGQPIAVTEAEPYLHYEKVKDNDLLRLIVSYDGLLYRIKSMINYGVTVYYDGKAIVVYLSPYYRGKQCGICGDFNNNNLDEFLGPQNCYFHNSTEFIHSYVIDDKCRGPEQEVPCTSHPSYEI